MAENIKFLEFLEAKRKIEARNWLNNPEREDRHPERARTFSWLLERIDSGECELIVPPSFGEDPFNKNPYFTEWLNLIDDKNYLCALFLNPQFSCNVFYAKSLRSSCGEYEKAFMVEYGEEVQTLSKIYDEYGMGKICDLYNNATAISA